MVRYRRILPADYDDGTGKYKINDRRRVGRGRTILLPNARTLSKELHYTKDERNLESSTSTHMVMQIGQFVDHDITLAPEDGKYELG